jgi:cysteine desulfurase
MLPGVQEAMGPFLRARFGNPSALHAEGIAARDAISRARQQVSEFLGAESSDEIIFTGNGTEAVNLAIKGAAFANQRRGKHIVLSAAEHPATNKSVGWLESMGFTASIVPVDNEGRASPEAVQAALTPETILVCLHHANHDLGTIQDIQRIGAMTSERGALLFVDAIASAGWLPLNVQQLRVDLVALSPHRFYGPKGVGVLYRHRRARLQSLIHGGEQEEGRRAGTEHVPAIVGAGAAAEIAQKEFRGRVEHTSLLQRKTVAALFKKIEFIKLNGPPPGAHRHPAHLNLSVEFVDGEGLGLMLDVRGIAVGTSTACVAKNLRVPAALAAIGLSESLAKGTVLISFGQENSEAEVDYLAETLAKCVTTLREMSPGWDDFRRGLIKSEIASAIRADS